MPISYPTSLDTLTNPAASDKTNSVSVPHATQHADLNDIAEALEAKVGIGASTPVRGAALIASGTGSTVYDRLARRNVLINGSFRVWQRGTSSPTTSDNAYGPDRWRLLLEAANAFTIGRETSDVPTSGGKTAAKLTVGSGNNNKGGLWQVLEGLDVKPLRGQQVSVQVQLRATDGITDARIAVVEFTGTEDSVSGDPISSWGSAGTNPTLAASYAYLGTPANLSPTTSWATYRVEGLTVGASANNLAVMVWSDDKTTTQTTDYLLVTDVQLEAGAVCTAVERRPVALELTLCQRYYESVGGDQSGQLVAVGQAYNTTQANYLFQYQPKRATPSISVSSASHFSMNDAGNTLRAAGTFATNGGGLRSANAIFTVASGTPMVAGDGTVLWTNSTSARLIADAEL